MAGRSATTRRSAGTRYPVPGTRYPVDEARLALSGPHEVATTAGPVACRPAFDLVAAQCRRMPPALAESMTGVPAAEIEQTARTLWQSRPVAFYTCSGLE